VSAACDAAEALVDRHRRLWFWLGFFFGAGLIIAIGYITWWM
jgi:hypothetical protein